MNDDEDFMQRKLKNLQRMEEARKAEN